MKKKNSAYTLLEILVVISIIAILIALGAVSYTTAQQKSRDARRKSDIKIYQNAFEQFYSQNGSSYPATLAEVDGTIFPAGAPTDPKGDDYSYSINTNVNGYCICAELENTAGNAGAPSGTICNFGTGNFFCIGNLQ